MRLIEVIFYIEGLFNDKKVLESVMGQIVELLKVEKGVEIKDIYVDEIVEDFDNDFLLYFGMIEVRIRGFFEVFVDLVICYVLVVVDFVLINGIEIFVE